MHVHCIGHVDPDGKMIFVQTVDGWEMSEAVGVGQPDRCGRMLSDTLTDAYGSIAGAVSGGRLRTRLPMKRDYEVRQRLESVSGGGSAGNHAIIRMIGILLATLDETTRKTS